MMGTAGDPTRSKDLEVLRSVEQAAALLSDSIPKSSSSVVKPSRQISSKDSQPSANAKELPKGARSQHQRSIMVRGIGAARVTSHGPFAKESTSQGAAAGLHRDGQQQQFASQLSLLKDSSFHAPSASTYQSATMYNPQGFQTRMLVASNAKAAAELSASKHYETQEAAFQGRKQQGILNPVLGTTNLQRKIVQSAVNEKMQNRAAQNALSAESGAQPQPQRRLLN